MSSGKSRVVVIWGVLILVAGWTIGIPEASAQGRLGQVRGNVRQHDPPPHTEDSDNDDDDHHHRPRRRRNRFRGGRGFGCSPNPFPVHPCAPQIVEHVHIYQPSPVAVPPPVYEPVVVDEWVDPTPVPEVIEDARVFESGLEDWFSGWSRRLTAFYGNDFDDLAHSHFGLLLQNPGGPGLDIGVSMFRESGVGFRDYLWLGDVNFVYEVIRTDRLRARMGIGVNWLADEFDGDAGANLTFGVDWKISPKWVLTGETDFGSLGDTDLFHAQLSIGRQFERAEWATGYNYHDIGGTGIGGVFTGLRFRF